MDIIHAIVLGIVQGLTEFLPVSSSGHLIMVPFVLGWEEHAQSFDLALHLGTCVALLGYFRKDWIALVRGFFGGLASAETRKNDEYWRLALLVLLGSVPAGIIGLVAEKTVESYFRSAQVNAILLIVFALVLLAADWRASRSRSMADVTWKDALIIGLAQSIALMPGVSRSGITLTAGLARGFDRASAARFSFLLSGPIIVAAALFKLRDGLPQSDLLPAAIGIVVSGAVGWAAIGGLLRFLQTNSTMVFVVYRILFGLFVLGIAFARGTAA